MPYLKYKNKEKIKVKGLEDLEEYYISLPAQEFAGAVNYLNFKLVKSWIEKNGKKYWILALFIGTLICCVFEIYRRIIAPYEDNAIQRNGDV